MFGTQTGHPLDADQMARKIRSPDLETRTARLKLAVRKKPYTVSIARGIRLAYRRNRGGGVWSVLKADGAGGSWLQRFALADDHEDANGSTILTFWRASEVARKLARGDDLIGEVEGGRPPTLAEAVLGYERDLRAREAGKANARILRFHVPPTLMSKPVALLTAREVRALRDSLLDKGLKPSSVNRFMTALKACLTLAAEDDERITNRRAWKVPALRDTANPRNVILTERQVRDLVAASHATGGDRFAAYVETLAATGARPIQARRLAVADLEATHRDGPRLNMPSSKKGRGKKRVERVPLPIPAGLAKRLKALAVGRADHEPLLVDDSGAPWTENGHQRPFAVAAATAGLLKDATAYSLRHTFITSCLLKGIPVRLVAAAVDSSAAMIEATYSKFITHPGADLMRGALIDFDQPSADDANVVPLRGKAS
jgi:site-specific recombinase XerD